MTAAGPARLADGFVLVNALVIVFVLSFLAVEILDTAGRRVGLIETARTAAQTDLLTDAGIAFAADLIARDDPAVGIDHRAEPWALDGYVATADVGTVVITVRDLESRFNVNLLAGNAGPTATEALTRLAKALGAPEGAVGPLVSRLASGPGQGNAPSPSARDGSFLSRDVTHPAQIAVTAGPALRDTLSALPQGRAVNVNTAAPEILVAVLGLDAAALAPLLDQRETTPFASVTEVVSVLETAAPGVALPEALLTVTSDWFEVETLAQSEGTAHRITAILRRDPETGDVTLFAKSPVAVEIR